MKKTLSKKKINGRDYFYLMYRKNGKLVTEYLGNSDSPKYRKYIYAQLETAGDEAFEECKREAFNAGVPLVYAEGGKIVLEYRNGTKELLDEKLRCTEVRR